MHLATETEKTFSSHQVSELLKLGGDNYENMKQFSVTVEEKLFRMSAHRDRALTYKTEEVQLTAVDEVYVEQDKSGHVVKHVCRVRVFFLSFLSGEYRDTLIMDTRLQKKCWLVSCGKCFPAKTGLSLRNMSLDGETAGQVSFTQPIRH